MTAKTKKNRKKTMIIKTKKKKNYTHRKQLFSSLP